MVRRGLGPVLGASLFFGCGSKAPPADPPRGELHATFVATGATNAPLAPFDIAEGQELAVEEGGSGGGLLGSGGTASISIGGSSNGQSVKIEIDKQSGVIPVGAVSSGTVSYIDGNVKPRTQWARHVQCTGPCGTLIVDKVDDTRIDFHFDGLVMEPGGLAGSDVKGTGTFTMSGHGWARRGQ